MGTLCGATDCIDTFDSVGRNFGRVSKDVRLSFLRFFFEGTVKTVESSTGRTGRDCGGEERLAPNGSGFANKELLGAGIGSETTGDSSEGGHGGTGSRAPADTADWYPESRAEPPVLDILSLITICRLGIDSLLGRLPKALLPRDMVESVGATSASWKMSLFKGAAGAGLWRVFDI